MDISELDGTYKITTISDYNGPIEKRSDGITKIIDGMTNRTDDNGCVWTTKLKILNDSEVLFTSISDPSNADEDFCLYKENGDLTSEPVTYTATLNIARKGDKIKLSGQIVHGDTTTIITMLKTS